MAQQQTDVTTDGGLIFLERAVVEGLAANETLTHLAIGDGPVPILSGVLQKPSKTLTQIAGEIGRAFFAERAYVVEDPAGAIQLDKRYRRVLEPSPLVYFRFLVPDGEALGPWTQFALIGGGVSFLERGATLVDSGGLTGDDRANQQVILSGGYSPAESERITVTCTLGGLSGAARIGWSSTGPAVPSASNVAVTFGVPVPITGSGLALTFSGGLDTVLTLGAQWEIRGTRAAVSAEYAANGVYDPALNQAGQVRDAGQTVRVIYIDPPVVKEEAAVNIAFVQEVVHT